MKGSIKPYLSLVLLLRVSLHDWKGMIHKLKERISVRETDPNNEWELADAVPVNQHWPGSNELPSGRLAAKESHMERGG